MLGEAPKPIFRNLPAARPHDNDLTEEEKCKIAFDRIRKKAETRKAKAVRRRKKWEPVEGHKVLLRKRHLSDAAKKRTHKMELLYSGPYKITKIFGNHTFELEDNNGKSIGRHHKQNLRPYKELQRVEDEVNDTTTHDTTSQTVDT